METISGKRNMFKFMGVYNEKTQTFNQEIPNDLDQMVFSVDSEGNMTVSSKYEVKYDEETGCLYLVVKEVG